MIFTATTSAAGKTRIMRRSWQKFYGTDSGLSSPESANSAVLDSLIVDIYRNNEYRKLADGENASEEEMAYKDFTLSVKKAGTSGNDDWPVKDQCTPVDDG